MCLNVKTICANRGQHIATNIYARRDFKRFIQPTRVGDTDMAMLQINSTGPINTSPSCNSPGSSYTIDANSGLQCTQNTTADSPVSLTWSDTSQIYIRARACTTPSDDQQNDNENVRIGLPVSVSLSPKMINPGGNITATYTNRLPRKTYMVVL